MRYQTFGDISRIVDKSKKNSIDKNNRTPPHDDLTEEVVSWIYKNLGEKIFIDSLKNFNKEHGTALSHEIFYHERLNYFNNCFVFQYLLKDSKKTPFELFKGASKKKMEQISYRHSLFLVTKTNKKITKVTDLLDKNKKFTINNGSTMMDALEKKTILQGILFEQKPFSQLARGFLLHPSSVAKNLTKSYRKKLKRKCFCKASFLKTLAQNNLNYLRNTKLDLKLTYKHIYN